MFRNYINGTHKTPSENHKALSLITKYRMESKDRALPVGFRFCPTDFEISNYFLKRKAFGQPMQTLTVPDECHDIFSKHPCDLPGYPIEKDWYLYCRKRDNQVTNNIWIPIGEETNVLDTNSNDALVVGIKRPFTLLDHEGESYDEEEEEEYNWFMDEIRLPVIVAENDWVMCHVFRKKIKSEIESECEEEESVVEELDLRREKDGIVLPPSPSPSLP